MYETKKPCIYTKDVAFQVMSCGISQSMDTQIRSIPQLPESAGVFTVTVASVRQLISVCALQSAKLQKFS